MNTRWKKQPVEQVSEETRSTELRQAARELARQDPAPGLERLDRLVAKGEAKNEVLRLLAEFELKRGRPTRARAALLQAIQKAGNDPHAGARAREALVRLLLVENEVTEAASAAETCLTELGRAWDRQNALVARAASTLPAGKTEDLPARPPRPASVAFRLGQAAWTQGESELAERFYRKSVELAPGHVGSRIALARLAARVGHWGTVEELAAGVLSKDPLSRAKLPAWELLVEANRQLGRPPLLESLKTALLTSRVKGPALRAVLLVTIQLRKHGDSSWLPLARATIDRCGPAHRSIADELLKMLLADANNPPDRLADATKLLANPRLAPVEWIEARRHELEARRELAQTLPSPDLLAADAARRYPAEWQPRLRHSLGLTFAKLGQHDGARAIWRVNASLSPASSWVARSRWQLAELEFSAARWGDAARAFEEIANDQAGPRSDLALVRAARCWARTPEGIPAGIRSRLTALASEVRDYAVALDTARQLIGTDKGLIETFRARGYELAERALAEAPTADIAVTVLFQWARRQNDFGDFAETVALWESLDAARRAWLWQEASAWWEFIVLVARAYAWRGDVTSARLCIAPYLADPATPPHGVAVLAVSLGLLEAREKRFADALSLFERAVLAAPTHPLTAFAHYHLAISQVRRADRTAFAVAEQGFLRAAGTPSPREFEWLKRLRAKMAFARAVLEGVSLEVEKLRGDHPITWWQEFNSEFSR